MRKMYLSVGATLVEKSISATPAGFAEMLLSKYFPLKMLRATRRAFKKYPQPRLTPMRRATVSSSQPSGTLRVLPAMSARRFWVTRPFTMATVTP